MFLRYENFRTYVRLYRVTSVLIALNILMYVLTWLFGGINVLNLVRWGALVSSEPFLSEWWRFITSMFLHASIGHLFFNLFALFVFAPPLERLIGWWRYLLLYFFSGLGGSFLWLLLNTQPMVPTVGASGAIYGVLGAYLYIALYRRNWMDEGSRKTVVIILVIGVLFSLLYPSINIYAHLGGLLAGGVGMGLYDLWRKRGG